MHSLSARDNAPDISYFSAEDDNQSAHAFQLPVGNTPTLDEQSLLADTEVGGDESRSNYVGDAEQEYHGRTFVQFVPQHVPEDDYNEWL